MRHTSSYLIESNPDVDNKGDTCNPREVMQGEERRYYPTEAATNYRWMNKTL